MPDSRKRVRHGLVATPRGADGRWRSRCLCGWTCPPQATRSEAARMMVAHVLEPHDE